MLLGSFARLGCGIAGRLCANTCARPVPRAVTVSCRDRGGFPRPVRDILAKKVIFLFIRYPLDQITWPDSLTLIFFPHMLAF
jgi:hypothetical protein